MRRLLSFLLLAAATAAVLSGQSPGTCAPPGTATCDVNGVPIPGGGGGGGTSTEAPTVNAVTAAVTLGAGRAVVGAEGIAIDPSTGLAYIGLNGTIVSGCEGDPTRTGTIPVPSAGANRMSIVDPAAAREVAAVATGASPIWPTVDPDRQLVFMMGSGGTGTVTVHRASDGATLRTVVVGGKPHMGGLDYSTRLMVIGNTVRASAVVAEQNWATVLDTNSYTIRRQFNTSPAPHGMAVDQDRDLVYFTAVGDGAIVAVNAATGIDVMTSVPKSAIGASFGNNNMLARQAATRRLFQTNAQQGSIGVLVIDEITLTLEKVVRFGSGSLIPWGMSVDEPNRLLFAALPNANAVGVVDLDSLEHVATIPVGACPYAVAVDAQRRRAVTSNQGTPTENASASILDLCPVYAATNRSVAGCSASALLPQSDARRPRR